MPDTFPINQTAGVQLPTPVELESTQPSIVKSTKDGSSLDRHPDAPAEKEKTCFFLQCATYIRDKIVSFFRCIFCCDRAATEEEIEAAKDAIDKAVKNAMPELVNRLDPSNFSCYRENRDCPLVVAAAAEGLSLAFQASFLRIEIWPADEKGSQTIIKKFSWSKLQAEKKKILELMAQCNQVKVAKKSTPALQKKVKDFSLAKWQLHKNIPPLQSMELLVNFMGDVHPRYKEEVVDMVNGIRKGEMAPFEMPKKSS